MASPLISVHRQLDTVTTTTATTTTTTTEQVNFTINVSNLKMIPTSQGWIKKLPFEFKYTFYTNVTAPFQLSFEKLRSKITTVNCIINLSIFVIPDTSGLVLTFSS